MRRESPESQWLGIPQNGNPGLEQRAMCKAKVFYDQQREEKSDQQIHAGNMIPGHTGPKLTEVTWKKHREREKERETEREKGRRRRRRGERRECFCCWHFSTILKKKTQVQCIGWFSPVWWRGSFLGDRKTKFLQALIEGRTSDKIDLLFEMICGSCVDMVQGEPNGLGGADSVPNLCFTCISANQCKLTRIQHSDFQCNSIQWDQNEKKCLDIYWDYKETGLGHIVTYSNCPLSGN